MQISREKKLSHPTNRKQLHRTHRNAFLIPFNLWGIWSCVTVFRLIVIQTEVQLNNNWMGNCATITFLSMWKESTIYFFRWADIPWTFFFKAAQLKVFFTFLFSDVRGTLGSPSIIPSWYREVSASWTVVLLCKFQIGQKFRTKKYLYYSHNKIQRMHLWYFLDVCKIGWVENHFFWKSQNG